MIYNDMNSWSWISFKMTIVRTTVSFPPQLYLSSFCCSRRANQKLRVLVCTYPPMWITNNGPSWNTWIPVMNGSRSVPVSKGSHYAHQRRNDNHGSGSRHCYWTGRYYPTGYWLLLCYFTLSPDYYFGRSVIVTTNVKWKIDCIRCENQCSGFLYALSVADQFIKTGMYLKTYW